MFCLLVLGGPARATPLPAPHAFVRQFGPADGLSQTFIYCLLQDRQGYLWLGTAEGLVRYDGARFVTLTTHDGLAEDFVTGLWEEPSTGRLWVAHREGGRSLRATPGANFQAVAATVALPQGWRPPAPGPPAPDTARLRAYLRRYPLPLPADVTPSCLLEDRDGNAWLGTSGQGLWRHSDRFVTLVPLPTNYAAAGTTLAPALLAGAATAIWGAAGSRFFLLDNPVHTLASAGSSGLLAAPVRTFLPRPAALGGGVWEGREQGGVWTAAKPGAPAARVLGLPPGLAVAALAYAPGSGLWVGTVADGIYYLPLSSSGVASLPAVHFTTANGLLHNQIYALLADRTGRVWIGTHGTGLSAWEPRSRRFRHYRVHASGLAVNTLSEDNLGTIWVGTEGQGLYYLPAGASRFSNSGTGPAGSFDDYTLAMAPLGEYLLLVHPQALTLLDTRRRTGRSIRLLARNFLPAAAVLNGRQPTAWVATQAGLLRLDVQALLAWFARTAASPSLALTGAEVDGESRLPTAIGELSAQQHRVSFTFQGLSLAAGDAPLLYQYRLHGLSTDWSRPSPAGEAQFVGLGAGSYLLEVRARYASPAATAWSPVVSTPFSIATPWWQQPWVLALGALAVLSGAVLVVRGRERLLRHQRAHLERTVRQRTSELRQKNAHIEQMNGELLVARDAAEASRRAKAQFLANMSHEIRTPMNAVIGLTNLLQNTQPTREQAEYLTAIGSSSQNLLVILNDILDSSKMEAGKLTLEQIPFRLPDAVRRLSTMFRYAADSKGLQLTIEVAPEVPAAVLGDPTRLQQVLINLVSNALKFTRQGSVSVQVNLAVPPAPDASHVALRFAVQDTGIGIAATKLNAIFEDFSQANASTTREFGGTGLGLSIARNLVQLHGGQLSVRSTEGVGSEFFFELTYPIADATLAQPEVHTGPLPAFEPMLRVLVAEDNELNQLVARKTLENWNVHVVIAANGRLAVEQATQAAEPFDAVLMDVQMPELDGYAATRALREFFPDERRLPIIGLTASVLPEDRGLALSAGMNDTLAKPFDPALLHARLAYFTGRQPTASTDAVATQSNLGEPAAVPLPILRPDWQLLEELACGNEAFIKQIVNTFLSEAPSLEEVLTAAFPHDADKLAQVAHKLKGQVAYFGVPVLHTQLDELERSARRADCQHCEPLLLAIRQQLGQLYPHLEERA
ncbi:hybrid sensor histidine kinase/response regulator [Hymenobacter setariae]|uniref:hybrid sensor histidine kinase/response regulator n=1 Tax=Hymenobacter setariae TaxID=2594794 RepID=UPI001F303DCA|nr:hybrid sensor histidine kinase/response regulator [Hymenobacter setariae]